MLRLFSPRSTWRVLTLPLLVLAGLCNSSARPVSVSIDVSQTGKPISADLFGIFFEDLNYAADGGLYAELVQNRSFEYNSTERNTWNALTGWELEKRGEGTGRVNVKSSLPIHPNNPHYVALAVEKPGSGVGLMNTGYEGIPLTGGDAYEVSFFGHQLYMGEAWGGKNEIEGRPMPMALRLEAPNGDLLAEASVEVVGREWKRYVVKLTPSRTENAARVLILGKAQGGVALDEVSVFPTKTFRNRPNGLRADLAQVVADLNPKFMRFPGGCLVHGDGVNNFYRWQDTIGPVETRKGQRNLWGYHQSVGLGYFEYFQFCEDIGAAPLPVVPAGVCCQNADSSPGLGQQGVPMEEMDAYIKDVLNLIEWANGPATSEWGKKRAEAGHPEPFGLKYLGVGNEDRITPVFEERYKLIQDAIKARHPEIVVIGTSGPFPDGEDFERGWAIARKLRADMVDEHYYRSPEWFWENLKRYDSYDRNGPKVYVGEYAAHEKDRRSTLRTALAEAAGLTSYERNGDVVILTSYAPLLARRNFTQWTPDMIYFTGTDVYPTINYHVQRLFSVNSGDRYLQSTVDAASENSRLAISSVRDSKSGDVIVKIVNGDGSAVPLSIRLDGLLGGQRKGRLTTLSSSDPDVVNEDVTRTAVVPVDSEIEVGPNFNYRAPAYSLSVLRIQ